MYHHSTTNVLIGNMVYERNMLEIYQKFLHLLLWMTQREKEEARQPPEILRQRRMRHLARRRFWCKTWLARIWEDHFTQQLWLSHFLMEMIYLMGGDMNGEANNCMCSPLYYEFKSRHDDIFKLKLFRISYSWPFCREFAGHWWISLTKGQQCGLSCSLIWVYISW